MDGDARLRVTLLGAFRVSRGETALVVPGARLRGLLVRLALAGGRAVEPAVLIDAIWGEQPPVDPAHALQALVSRLRRALGPAGDVALADARGRPGESAFLLGAAARLRGAHDRTDRQVGDLARRGRAALGEEAFATAYEKGWRLARGAAATSVVTPQPSST